MKGFMPFPMDICPISSWCKQNINSIIEHNNDKMDTKEQMCVNNDIVFVSSFY